MASVAITNRILGLGRRREVARDQIALINTERSGTTDNGREYRRIFVETAEQRGLTLLSNWGCQEEVDLLAADLRTVVALAESRTADDDTRIPLDDDLPADFCGR